MVNLVDLEKYFHACMVVRVRVYINTINIVNKLMLTQIQMTQIFNINYLSFDNMLKANEYDKISANGNTIIVFVRNTMAIVQLVYG